MGNRLSEGVVMRVIIAGSRNIQDASKVEDAVRLSGFDITEVVSGGAGGVDKLGEQWAKARGMEPRVSPAKWRDKSSPTYSTAKGYDPRAGYRRNTEMAEYADALIAIWDGKSGGTGHMITEAKRLGLVVFVYLV